MKKLILFIFLITSQIFAQTTYYISSTDGDDSDNGLTEATAWATMQKLSSSMVAGNIYLLKRGDTFNPGSLVDGRRGVLVVDNLDASASAYTYIDAYGSGNPPVISADGISYSRDAVFIKGSCSYIHIKNVSIDGKLQFNMDKTQYGATTGVHHFKLTDFEMVNGSIYMNNHLGIGQPYNHVPESNDPYCNPFYKIEIGDGIMTEGEGGDYINFIYGIRYITDAGVPINITESGNLLNTTGFANRGQIDWTNETMPDTNIWLHDLTILNIGLNGEAIDVPGGNLHLIERIRASGSRNGGGVIKMHSEYSKVTDCIVRDVEATGQYWNYPYDPNYDPLTNPNSAGNMMGFESISDCIIESNTFSARYPMVIGDNTVFSGMDAYFGTFEGNTIRNNNFYGSINIGGEAGVSSTAYRHAQQDSIKYLNKFEGNNYWINQQWVESPLIKAVWDYNDNKNISPDNDPVGGYRGTWTEVWVNEFQVGNSYPQRDYHINPQMTDPVFTNPYDRGDYTLIEGSPLIDAGYPTGIDHIYDIDKNVRTQGVIDVGAYETSGGVIRPKFNVTAYSGGTYTAPTFNYGTVQPSESKTGKINLTNASPDSTITLTSGTLGGTFDSLFTIVDYYAVITGIEVPVTLPYEVPVSGVVRIEVDFDGSTIASTKSATLSLVHSSTSQTSPIVINLSATVSDGSVTYAISGDTTKVFTSALGAEELTNWDLTSWSATDPVGWTVQGEDVLPSTANSINETATGSGVARLLSDGTFVAMKQYSVVTSGGKYLFEIDIDAVTLGSLKLESASLIKSWSTAQVDKFYYVPDGTSIALARGSSSGNTQVDINYVSVKEITSSWNATATITATGNLTCDDISLTNGTNFSITSATLFDLADGETFDLTYSFVPSDTGYFKDTIIISGLNSSNVTVDSLFLEGYFETAFSPSATKNLKTIGLTGSTFTLANTDTGSTSADSVQFYNDGDGDLTLDSLVWSGGDYTQFNLLTLTTDDTTLSAGDTTDLGIQFAPTTSGVKTAYLAVYHNADNIVSPLVITVTGQATVVQTEPYVVFINPLSGSLSFGATDVNTTTQAMIIWRNDGDETYNYQVTQSFGTVFEYYSGDLNDSTQTDELDTLIYTFTPNVAGSHSDTLKFAGTTSNHSDPYTIILSGTGIPSAAEFEIDYSYYNFGVQDTSDADTLTITITDGGAGVLSGVISLPTSEQFTLLNGGAYSTYATKTFQVIAQPTDEMYYEIDVTITHNATNVTSPQTVTLAVTGDVVSKLALIPTNYHFGSVYLGDSKTSSNLIAYNKGRDTITVDSIYLATNSVFTIADTLGATLPGNLVYNGGFDRTDTTIWVYAGCEIEDNKLAFINSTFNGASQVISGLKYNTAYLLVMDVSTHTGTGDALQINLAGNVIPMITDYSNGTLAIQLYSGDESSSLSISLFNGTKGTRLDNITLSEYTATQVTFTPVAGTTSNVDNLSYEHNDANSLTANPLLLPITGYMTSGGITINGNIEVNTVKKK